MIPNTGLVGARLRDCEGRLTHAGILFDRRHSPYHQLDRLLPSRKCCTRRAKTGASSNRCRHADKTRNFQLLFNSDYRVCGEDAELCLALGRSSN